jgi:hypothetical protein
MRPAARRSSTTTRLPLVIDGLDEDSGPCAPPQSWRLSLGGSVLAAQSWRLRYVGYIRPVASVAGAEWLHQVLWRALKTDHCALCATNIRPGRPGWTASGPTDPWHEPRPTMPRWPARPRRQPRGGHTMRGAHREVGNVSDPDLVLVAPEHPDPITRVHRCASKDQSYRRTVVETHVRSGFTSRTVQRR